MAQKLELATAENWESTLALGKPCGKCPFRRDSSPTPEGSGFSHPMRYIGQAHGPFGLPCHQAGGFDPETGKANVGVGFPQCAGAAIYRSNVGVADKLPDSFLKLPEDKTLVFATPAEMLAHYLHVPVVVAQVMLLNYPVEQATHDEMERAKQEGKLMLIKRKDGE